MLRRIFDRLDPRTLMYMVGSLIAFALVMGAWTLWNRPKVLEPAVAVALATASPVAEILTAPCQSAQSQAINLNSATRSQLEALPGVGPVMAQRIIDWREHNGRFSDIRELREIDGIGEKVFRKLAALVTL